MITTTIFPGRYIQGYGAIKRLGPEIARLGHSGFLICGPTVYAKVLPAFREEVEKYAKVVVEKFGGECCDDEIDRLHRLAERADCELVIGVGGGKVMDTAKAVAHKRRTHLVIVPTLAASDAPCSAVSVIHNRGGMTDRPMPHPRNPDVVLVDTQMIVEAPVRFLVAGMGDALSTWFESESCQKKYAPNMTFTGDIGSMTGYALARLCYETVLEYGLIAKKACEQHAIVPAVEHIVEANTLLSGLGFESGGIAGAHGIQMGLSTLKETHHSLHGEVVAFSTLASLFLTDKKQGVIDEVFAFCESVGLPTTLIEIGVDVSDSILTKVAEAVLAKDNPIYNEPIPVTQERIIGAMKAADYEGRLRKRV